MVALPSIAYSMYLIDSLVHRKLDFESCPQCCPQLKKFFLCDSAFMSAIFHVDPGVVRPSPGIQTH